MQPRGPLALVIALLLMQTACIDRMVGVEANLRGLSFDAIRADTALHARAIARGAELFAKDCNVCHGAAGEGNRLWCPPLNDDEWIWGGSDTAIASTIKYGVRQMAVAVSRAKPLGVPAPSTRYSIMPRFDTVLSPGEISEVAEFVRAMNEERDGSAGGREIYVAQCASCHGMSGEGNAKVGAPRLVKHHWIDADNPANLESYIARDAYRSTSRDIRLQHRETNGMPEWGNAFIGLTDSQIKAIVLYIRTLRR
jgi:cbb3-type cytochrome c oxidase subunit III